VETEGRISSLAMIGGGDRANNNARSHERTRHVGTDFCLKGGQAMVGERERLGFLNCLRECHGKLSESYSAGPRVVDLDFVRKQG